MCCGKQKSVYGKTYDECLQKLNDGILRRNERSDATDKLLVDWLYEFLSVYKNGKVAVETYKQMQRNIRIHIEPNIDDVGLKLADVRPIHLQRILNAVERIRTRESVYNVLSGAMRQAYAEQLVKFNPMLAVGRVKAKRNKGKALTVDEHAEFMEKLEGSKLEKYYLFCLYSGCRRNEALGVCRGDVDEKSGVIHIRGTKTEGSDRFIPLFDTIFDILFGKNEGEKLFDFMPDYVSKRFKKYCPGHVLHDLRHTFATRALDAGVPMKVVQTWLGHADLSTTADIYTDVSRELSFDEAKKLDRYFTVRGVKHDDKNGLRIAGENAENFDTKFDTKTHGK